MKCIMENIAVFPGSFDPITVGHMSLIERALPLFKKIYVAVGINPDKKNMFAIQDRIEWCKKACEKHFPDDYDKKIEVVSYNGLTAEFCKDKNAPYLIRGLRGGADFEYENMIYHANRLIYPTLETLYFITENKYIGVSSSVVRDIYKHGGDVSHLIPEGIDLSVSVLK